MRLLSLLPMVAVLCLTGTAQSDPTSGSAASPPRPVPSLHENFQRIVDRARLEVSRGVVYDSRYVSLSYPGGDLDPTRGVCTDLVIRALREVGIDLQRLVHEDILSRPTAYKRGGKRADSSIDHRRATALLVWFESHARGLPHTVETEEARASYAPGDVMVWSLHNNGQAEHVGIISDRKGPRGLPLVIHNIGPHPSEEDVLDAWQILGHYRATPPVRARNGDAAPEARQVRK